MRLRNRHAISKKELKLLAQKLASIFGKPIIEVKEVIEKASAENITIFIINSEPIGFFVEGEPFLTLKGLLRYQPEKRYITVDRGAVRAIASGAHLMAPGIVELDRNISKGNLVWLRDEIHKKPLAVAKALMNAEEMLSTKKGKVAQTVHHLGDKLWTLCLE